MAVRAVLGVGRFHDAGAAIFLDGEIRVVAEAERVLDLKHAGGPQSVPPAVEAALAQAGLEVSDISAVVVADTHGEMIECRLDVDPGQPVRGWDTLDPEVTAHTHGDGLLMPLGVAGAPQRLRMKDLGIAGLDDDVPVYGVCHHASHAASAIYMSGFEDGAVLTADGFGVCNGTAAYSYRGGNLQRIEGLRDAALLGWRYSLFGHLTKEIDPGSTNTLDLAGKVMGLNAYGSPVPRLVTGLEAWFREGYETYGQVFDRDRAWFADLLGGEGIRRGEGSVHDKAFLDMIASMQEAFSNVMCDLARRTLAASASRHLAIAGGCALNVLANSRIANLPELDELFVLPCAGDGGLPMGAAVIGGSRLTGTPLHQPAVASRVRRNPYLGLSLIDDLDDASRRSGVAAAAADPATVSRLVDILCANQIVGMATERAELGPRALGHRSILASGIDPAMRDVLNAFKRREWWRPFAPVCRALDAAKYFDGGPFSQYMLTSVTVKPEYRKAFSAAAHEDGSARLQVIPDRDAHPLLWDVLTEFGARTGIGVLINTSFNIGGKPLLNRASTALGMMDDGKLSAVWIDGLLFRNGGQARSGER